MLYKKGVISTKIVSLHLKTASQSLFFMSYARKAVYGTSLVFILSMLGGAAAYITRVVLARGLGPEKFGLFSSVFTLVIFFLFFRDLGFPQALIKYVAEFQAQKKYGEIKSAILSVFAMQMIGSIFLGLIFFFMADFLAIHYFKAAEAAPILKILIIYIFGSVLFIVTKDTLLGLQQTFLFALGEFMKNTIVLGLVLLFFAFGMTLYAPVWAYAFVCFVLFLFYLPWLLHYFPFFKEKISDYRGVRRSLFFFAVPVFFTAAGGKVIGYIDTLLLTYFRPLEEVGVYNAVLPTALLFLYLGSTIATTIFPIVSELLAKKDHKRVRDGLRLIYKYLVVISFPIVGYFLVYAHFFLVSFFGLGYITGVLAFQILLIGVMVFMIASINHTVFSAIGKPALVTKIILGSAVLNIIANLFLIPRYGLTGAALSTTLSYILAFVWSMVLMKKHLGVQIMWIHWAKSLFVTFIYVFILFQLKNRVGENVWWYMPIIAFISLLIYFILAFCFHLIDITELKRYLLKHDATT